MEHVGSLLSKALAKRGLKDQAQASLVVHQAQEWLLEALPPFHGMILVQKCENGVLFVKCEHSIAAQECHQVVDALLCHLRDECGCKMVESVRIIR